MQDTRFCHEQLGLDVKQLDSVPVQVAVRRRFLDVGVMLGLAVLVTVALGSQRTTSAAEAVGSLSVLEHSRVVNLSGGKTSALQVSLTKRAAQGVLAQPAGLKIVVIAGEDAVNIIQQKTAVAPVVEVRDRNDQPVGGAVVTFAIRGGRATFSGARTLTVATNAAGRAVATGLTPTGAGTLQIGASAAYQGQTAIATIVQTNVMTAAEAATAAGAGASGGGAGAGSAGGASVGGGGGGLSATTIGLVGAAAAGGAVAVAKASGGDDHTSPIGPGTGAYSGSATMTVVDTAQSTGLLNAPGNVGGSCTFTRSVAVTMTADLAEDSRGVVSQGRFTTRWTETELNKSCPTTATVGGSFGPQTDDIDGQPVGSLRFNHSDIGSAPVGATITFLTSFTGSLSGDTISGIFTMARTQVGPGDARENRPPTSTAMTLRRQ